MRKVLLACILSSQLIISPGTHADETANIQKCEPSKPDKRVNVPRPLVKTGDSVQEVNVYCGNETDTHAPSPNPNEKCPCSPQEWGAAHVSEFLDALAKLLAALAWPVAAVSIVLVLRTEIKDLLSRLKRGKWAGAEFEFAEDVRAAEEAADIPRTPETQQLDAVAVEKATLDPRGAILSAWLDVEAALNILVERKNLGEGYTRITKRPTTAIRLVQKAELLSPNHVNLFQDLRAMRNEAAHSTDFSPPADAVARYVRLAQELAAELRRRADS
jgi:hypothetical protein